MYCIMKLVLKPAFNAVHNIAHNTIYNAVPGAKQLGNVALNQIIAAANRTTCFYRLFVQKLYAQRIQ